MDYTSYKAWEILSKKGLESSYRNNCDNKCLKIVITQLNLLQKIVSVVEEEETEG